MQVELTPKKILVITLTVLGLINVIPSPALAMEVEDLEVPDSRISPRGTFVFGLTAGEVNPDHSIPQEVGPRTDHIWTDLYANRDELFHKLDLSRSSLVIPNQEQLVVPEAEVRIIEALNQAYETNDQLEKLGLVENASTFYSYKNYFEDFKCLRDIHPDNYKSYSQNELNSVMYKSIENSSIFMDPNFRPKDED